MSVAKFRREFPEVGLKQEELTEAALRAFLDADKDPGDELLEELGGSTAIKKRRVASADPNVPKRKRGRPPKARPIQAVSPAKAPAPKTVVEANVTSEQEPAPTGRAPHDVAIGVCRLEVMNEKSIKGTDETKVVERQSAPSVGEEGPRE